MSIILIGFMGAGKSTVAKLLAEEFTDLDQLIEEEIEMPIATFFELFGEADFRKIENEVFELAVQKDIIIATGGGIIENPKNLEALDRASRVVFLTADFDTLWKRISMDWQNVRPLAQDKEAAQLLFEKRMKDYAKVADLTIDVTDKSPEQIAELIREKWEIE
ncbi:Shikimate kinase I [Lactococcus cremoris]|uniref:Shikimate kinase n=1 Tax=Lactococcus lactis subsp. cremoris TaxID=1359 RepID=A0A166KE72_LACLC|nr:RNase adapter RapZ [Lactococcus cremoris]KZK08273.1 Shikimate kinase I [Lactococcus cremoris]